MMNIILKQGDCIELMKELPDASIDMVLCDMPYGTTPNVWDKKIPLKTMWEGVERIIKEHGTVLFFAQQPFAAELIAANKKHFRYEWIWDKGSPTGFLNANRMPLRRHENILVFYKHLPAYHPQFSVGKPYTATCGKTQNYRHYKKNKTVNDGRRYPTDIVTFSKPNNTSEGKYHPTQKPVALLSYLIKTYTDPGDTVLDFCMGSGSTGVACIETGRNFIGYELSEKYYQVAAKRCEAAKNINKA